MNILGMCGSLRKGSYNRLLIDAAASLAREPVQVSFFECGDLPFFNEDIEAAGRPAAVDAMLTAIESADALLLATPEYNHSVSAPLKNALDWASRPAFKSVLVGKPCAIVSASMSPVGGVRAQAHLKAILTSTLSLLYPAPDCSLPMAQHAFDEAGKLADEAAERRLARYINDFADWVASSQGQGRLPD